MIHEIDADHLPGGPQADREEHVLDARIGVARWVVVEHDQRGGPGDESLAIDLARVRHACVKRAGGHEAHGNQPVPGVEQQYAKSLDRVRAKLRDEVGGNVPRSEKLWACRRRRKERAPPQLDCCLYPAGLHGTNPGQLTQPVAMEPSQTVCAACQGQDLVGHGQRARACGAVADQHRQQFVVTERPHTASLQLLSRTIVRRQVDHGRRYRENAPAILFMRMRRFVCAVVLATAVVACSGPPTKERDQAQGALDAARAAGAATYAAAELRSAETALAGYDAAVSQRDYRLALSLAIDAREDAYAAARRAADEKARSRNDADELIAAVEKGIAAIEQRLNGKAGARPSRQLATRLTSAIKTATPALQKARSRLAVEDYRGVLTLLTPVRKALDEALHAATPARGRGGR